MADAASVSSAVSLLKRALPEMSMRDIAATPENYAVWYEYVLGRNPDLKSEIERLDANNLSYSPKIQKDLYTRFVAGEHETAVNNLGDRVKEIISELLAGMLAEGRELGQYANTLESFSSQAEAANDVADLNAMLSTLVGQTSARKQSTDDLQDSLQSMSKEIKKLRSEISKLSADSMVDELTKVNNARAFDLDVDELSSDALELSKPLSLLMLDLDHFTQFNEQFGAEIGNKVLRFVAILFKKNLKGGDVVARIEDDQFAVLLPETDYRGALVVAENIRAKLAKQTLSDSAAKRHLGAITLSAGVTTLHPDDYTETFVGRANACLKRAQLHGDFVVGEEREPDALPDQVIL